MSGKFVTTWDLETGVAVFEDEDTDTDSDARNDLLEASNEAEVNRDPKGRDAGLASE